MIQLLHSLQHYSIFSSLSLSFKPYRFPYIMDVFREYNFGFSSFIWLCVMQIAVERVQLLKLPLNRNGKNYFYNCVATKALPLPSPPHLLVAGSQKNLTKFAASLGSCIGKLLLPCPCLLTTDIFLKGSNMLFGGAQLSLSSYCVKQPLVMSVS